MGERPGWEQAVWIRLDLSEAFELVNHSILLNKMEKYGVRGGEWSGFLAGWRQRACVREEKWEWADVKMDVPQGSILGQLLYAICVNSLPESVEQVKQYADGTAMFQFADSVSELEVVLRASPIPHRGKSLVNWVFKCCPLHTEYCAPIRAQYSVMWDIAIPNTHLTTKCKIDCHSGSAENCLLEVARSIKNWRKIRY